jgi:hypothetical protein
MICATPGARLPRRGERAHPSGRGCRDRDRRVDHHERPELLGAARALLAHAERGEPLTENADVALEPRAGAAAMAAPARQLGLSG